MEIFFFHRNPICGPSIEENFKPLIGELANTHNVKVFHVPYGGANPINVVRNILYIRKHRSRTGINHVTGDIHYGILGLIGTKSVLTIHDDYVMRLKGKSKLYMFYRWLFWIYFPIRFASRTICITPMTKELILKVCNSSKLEVITHHVVPDGLYPKNKPFNENYPHLLQIGAASPNKNLSTTLEAIKGLRCKLIVLKKMTDEQMYKAKKYNIDFENKFNLPFEEVIAAYDDCDIVLFPSLYEGLGVPIFEGQAAGKPVITTDRLPMSWVAGDGALLLKNPLDSNELREKIVLIIENEKLRKEIVERGLRNAKRFNLKESVKKYENLYKSIL